MENNGIVVFFDGTKWDWILPGALNPHTKIIAANIVNENIRLVYEDITSQSLKSIVARLADILYKHFEFFNGKNSKAISIITPFYCLIALKSLKPLLVNWHIVIITIRVLLTG